MFEVEVAQFEKKYEELNRDDFIRYGKKVIRNYCKENPDQVKQTDFMRALLKTNIDAYSYRQILEIAPRTEEVKETEGEVTTRGITNHYNLRR